jgi:hypothetical protein
MRRLARGTLFGSKRSEEAAFNSSRRRKDVNPGRSSLKHRRPTTVQGKNERERSRRCLEALWIYSCGLDSTDSPVPPPGGGSRGESSVRELRTAAQGS